MVEIAYFDEIQKKYEYLGSSYDLEGAVSGKEIHLSRKDKTSKAMLKLLRENEGLVGMIIESTGQPITLKKPIPSEEDEDRENVAIYKNNGNYMIGPIIHNVPKYIMIATSRPEKNNELIHNFFYAQPQ